MGIFSSYISSSIIEIEVVLRGNNEVQVWIKLVKNVDVSIFIRQQK